MDSQIKNNNLEKKTQSKPHFQVLDGLRGLAALAVLVFHYVELIQPNYTKNLMAHSFLAVDFFFCLSGFVIAYAYDDRIGKIGVKRFFINRLIRLHPLVVFGTLLGLIAYLTDPGIAISDVGWFKITMATIASMVLIPVVNLPGRFGCIFPLNGPAWSLFFEYVISIVYAFVIIRVGKKVLAVILFISAGILLYTSYKAGWLVVGWNFASFSGGFIRVLFSFLAGVFVFRYNLIIKNKTGLWLPVFLLIAVFVFPHAPNDWIRESLLVILALPVILALGAGAKAGRLVSKFCKLIGDLSYPIYMLHYSTVFLFFYYLQSNPDLSIGNKYMIASGFIIVNVLVAFTAMKLFDEPLRRWLKKKILV